MRTATRVTCDIDNLSLTWWDKERKKSISIGLEDLGDCKTACAALGCSKEMLNSLIWLTWHIKQAIGNDLRDIWERLDRLEELVQKGEP